MEKIHNAIITKIIATLIVLVMVSTPLYKIIPTLNPANFYNLQLRCLLGM